MLSAVTSGAEVSFTAATNRRGVRADFTVKRGIPGVRGGDHPPGHLPRRGYWGGAVRVCKRLGPPIGAARVVIDA